MLIRSLPGCTARIEVSCESGTVLVLGQSGGQNRLRTPLPGSVPSTHTHVHTHTSDFTIRSGQHWAPQRRRFPHGLRDGASEQGGKLRAGVPSRGAAVLRAERVGQGFGFCSRAEGSPWGGVTRFGLPGSGLGALNQDNSRSGARHVQEPGTLAAALTMAVSSFTAAVHPAAQAPLPADLGPRRDRSSGWGFPSPPPLCCQQSSRRFRASGPLPTQTNDGLAYKA